MWLALLLACSSPTPPPDVLLVTLDTTRADVLGVYGAINGASPSLDALAADAVVFDRAYSVTPLTIPAHSSLFTGVYPPRHGVRDNGDHFLDDAAVTLAERLRDRGYQTMASVAAQVTSHHWGFGQGFDAFFDDFGAPVSQTENRWRVERRGDAVVDDALRWLSARDRDRPAFAWVHLFDAHHPYAPPSPFAGRHAARPYVGEVAFADAQLGRLLAAIDLERTLVVVLADHGESLGEHGEPFHGTLLYDATTHVPLVVRPPSGSKRARVATPVSLVDVAPTILAFVGAAPLPDADGLDLSAIVRADGAMPARDEVYVESLYAWAHYGWAQQKALVTGTHKLIGSTNPELYGPDDAGEARNLAAAEPARLTELAGRLAAMADRLEPLGDVAGEASLSADRQAQLEALGYVTGSATPDADAVLPDPVDQLPLLADVERARAALRDGDTASGRAMLDAVLARDPGMVEPRLLRARLALAERDVATAAALVDALDAERPSSQTKALRADLAVVAGDLDAAAALLAESTGIDPNLASTWRARLRVLMLLGHLDALRDATREAADRLGNDAVVVGMQGTLRAIARDLDGAEPLLVDALAREPDQPFVRHALAVVRRSQGRVSEAEDLLLEEASAWPPAVPSRRQLVEMYADQKRYEEQLAQLDAIAATEPPSHLTMHSRAQALFNAGRFAEALPVVEECETLAPAYPDCPMLRANVLARLGRDADARAAYEHALALAGEARAPASPPAAP